MASGDLINASDYNNIRVKVANILGTGSGQTGYGQTVLSALNEATGDIIGTDEWDNLRNDIINIGLHQTNAQPFLTDVAAGDVITFGSSHPNNQYDTQINSYTTTKFNVSSARIATTAKLTKTYTTAWATALSYTATLTFASANEMRYFFNSGGKIRIASSRSGGTASTQNTDWTNLLAAAGNIDFGANTATTKKVYELTNAYQTIYSALGSGAYSTNEYRIEAKCNVATNSGATATIIDIRVQWIDNHLTGFQDSVDGTLQVDVAELKATGSMLPSGTFTITSGTFTDTAITGS